MEHKNILDFLNNNYPINFDSIEFVRVGGSASYTLYANNQKYFLRIVKPAFFDTAVSSTDIHLFLQKSKFPVPPIIVTKENMPFIQTAESDGNHFYILYDFIEGGEVDPEKDAEPIGALLGKFHKVMRSYTGTLIKHDKQFFINRYIEILRTKKYPKTDEFKAIGDALWEKVKDLPRGYCHGDMYRGNIHKTPDGKMYILDFNTSCEAFQIYDPVLICNLTDYFSFDERGYERSKKVFERFLPEYLKYNILSQHEIDAFYDLIAVYHFQLQATIIELFGIDCVDEEFLDIQLDWLYKWRKQCEQFKGK